MSIKKHVSKTYKGLVFTSLLTASYFASASGTFNITLNGLEAFSTTQQTAFSSAKIFWENIITGYQPGVQTSGRFGMSGITIDTTSIATDGVGGVLGSAGPQNLRSLGGYTLATTGAMNFDSADLGNMDANGILENIIKHEMAHVIGFGSLWQNNNLYIADSGQYTGSEGLTTYQAEFDSAANFIPVELDGGPGTANGHWNEEGGLNLTGITDSNGNDMRDELMTGIFYNNGKTFFSDTTIASFQDLGYTVSFPVAVPVPAAFWLFISAFSFLGFNRKNKQK